MIIQLDKHSYKHKEILLEFLKLLGENKKSFRYYETRDISIIENHLCTLILIEKNIPVGYGHLDCEGNHIWLGISMIEGYTGKGYGRKIMDNLILIAQENKIGTIRLAVDKNNIQAQTIYNKYDFKKISELSKSFIYEKKLGDDKIY